MYNFFWLGLCFFMDSCVAAPQTIVFMKMKLKLKVII